jgi:hypothetical protein
MSTIGDREGTARLDTVRALAGLTLDVSRPIARLPERMDREALWHRHNRDGEYRCRQPSDGGDDS